MRLIFALIYIASGIWVYLALGGKNLNLFIGIGVAFALLLSSDVLFNDGFIRRIRGQSYDDYVDQLIKNKKAGIESFDVHDAVTFEDLNTGGLCHLLHISINKIICLHGQYLYDYFALSDTLGATWVYKLDGTILTKWNQTKSYVLTGNFYALLDTQGELVIYDRDGTEIQTAYGVSQLRRQRRNGIEYLKDGNWLRFSM